MGRDAVMMLFLPWSRSEGKCPRLTPGVQNQRASKCTSRLHARMLLFPQVLVLLLSQDTSFAANVHRVPLPGGAPWYKEQLLSGARGSAADGASAATASGPDGAAAAVAGGAAPAPGGLTLGSLLVIVCLRTVSANFGGAGSGPGSELQLPTNALAALVSAPASCLWLIHGWPRHMHFSCFAVQSPS